MIFLKIVASHNIGIRLQSLVNKLFNGINLYPIVAVNKKHIFSRGIFKKRVPNYCYTKILLVLNYFYRICSRRIFFQRFLQYIHAFVGSAIVYKHILYARICL